MTGEPLSQGHRRALEQESGIAPYVIAARGPNALVQDPEAAEMLARTVGQEQGGLKGRRRRRRLQLHLPAGDEAGGGGGLDRCQVAYPPRLRGIRRGGSDEARGQGLHLRPKAGHADGQPAVGTGQKSE